ncbi:hypothetical protein D7Y13_24800 [Corallococcus praedator]|uniref:Uncharacterized protein n=1 Tax=Corallococcus praedator TaxID=2316724 RepID=A0ABX9QDB7_9BACT|nr:MULTISPECIES: hypothetical protein [Corallococcus]RKH10583.1 hypothetical protein D7X74_27265 [Corallococcus sp. CA047B]RKH26595.1 hypothetical protein D7X75_28015 [Corallococcus sp. CA031C]RKI02363.1 hypothetical protein D7Y13_24800 [Corallococcus praedator]
MANPLNFDRDFGYLLPFMDKVASAASDLPDASARAELVQLMAEEKVRWERIRSLLQGASGRGAPAAAREASSKQPVAPPLARVSSDDVNRVARREAGFTVGSLKSR